MTSHQERADGLVLDEVQLRASVGEANIPTLLLVLAQFTGDLRWLEPPFQPVRARGLDDNDDGGLPEDVQQEIREAAVAVILDHWAGRPIAISDPSHELLVRMMSVSMGEPVPDHYAPMMAYKLAAYSATIERGNQPSPAGAEMVHAPPEGFHVLIIGAGMSGLCAAIQLRAMSVPFTIIERHNEVGGTWWMNRYPGCGVDTPSHLYSFTFARREWSAYYVLRDELQEYFKDIATDFGLRPHIRFNSEVQSCRYDADSQIWFTEVRNVDGTAETLQSNVVISAVGAFGRPKWPSIEGLETFDGPVAHTAQWPADLDLTGRRVAVIGNGASAMQLVPAVVDRTEHVIVFQRSPQWAAPFEKFQRPIPESQNYLFATVPMYETWYRMRLGWTFDSKVYPSLQKDPEWPHPERSLNIINEGHRRFFTRYIAQEIGERQDLLESVVPQYPPYGKRILMDNGWYRTVARDDVTLVMTPIQEIRPEGVVTEDGTAYEADVLVIATGFDVVRFLAPMDIRGRDGRSLRDAWDDDDPRAYLGTSVPGFPNFFILYGPNTQAGHGGSLMFLVESQMHYVSSILDKMFAEDIGAVECRQDVHDDYNARIDEAHQKMVWTHPSMTTYYRNQRGRVVVNSPWQIFDFWTMTQNADLDDYLTEPVNRSNTAV